MLVCGPKKPSFWAAKTTGRCMPTRKLLIKVGDTFQPKTEIIGPGYRAAPSFQ